jgi:hypothetical protein
MIFGGCEEACSLYGVEDLLHIAIRLKLQSIIDYHHHQHIQ